MLLPSGVAVALTLFLPWCVRSQENHRCKLSLITRNVRHLLTYGLPRYAVGYMQYVGLASYAVLVYDHLLTLDDEIKYIWKKKKGSPRA